MTDNKALERSIQRSIAIYLALLVGIYIVTFYFFIGDILRFFEHIWIFGPIGVFGAIIANSTGTGGGVVFVPAFNTLSGASEMGMIPMEITVDPVKTIGISFLIQCFGMSVGSAVWTYRFYGGGKVHPADYVDGHSFLTILFAVLCFTLPTLLITQTVLFNSVDGKLLLTAFKWFSLLLGAFLLVFTWAYKRVRPYRFTPERVDIYWLMALGAIGGVITAFFSVGVGELVAVYLILRKFPTVASIAAAVIISAITVIVGISFHIWSGNIVWPVALTAIPGAMVGGFVARLFALWLGPLWLKTFASLWIVASSAFLILAPLFGVLPK